MDGGIDQLSGFGLLDAYDPLPQGFELLNPFWKAILRTNFAGWTQVNLLFPYYFSHRPESKVFAFYTYPYFTKQRASIHVSAQPSIAPGG